ncbi:MAG: recombination protein RecR [Caldisericaceae bacterium]|jgi:recombination protein RecR|nr:recombination protein RecR [Caldisericaceae bacterium]
MSGFPKKVERLIEEIQKLPGIGPKSAERIALHIVSMEKSRVDRLVSAINEAKENLHLCPICFNLTDKEICDICADSERDHSIVCVVEEVRDLYAIEKSGEYKGVYHVLHGRIDPMNHVSVEDLRIKELVERVAKGNVKEVILAMNPNFNGDITSLYITKLLKPYGIKITRIATGLPKGTEIDFVDSVTLTMALKDRKEIT